MSYFRAFRAPASQTPDNFTAHFVTALLWLAAIAPLALLAYDLGAQHTEARRLNTAIWRGIRETWRVAWQRPRLDEMSADFAETPADDSTGALLRGFAVGLIPLVLFLGAIPELRTVPGTIWVGGAGLLFGITAYCQRRAVAYLREDPGAWNLFRQWSLLNVDRYEPEGRRFVRAQIACVILLAVWWLGGGALVWR